MARFPHRRLGLLGRASLLIAVVAGLAGCVSMANSGPVGVSASPQTSAAPAGDFIGPIPVGPQPGWGPAQIVSGFLTASASYPIYSSITDQYLASSAARQWHPGWSVTVLKKVIGPDKTVTARHGQQATVDVSGTVQATFNGSGEFVSAQGSHQQTNAYPFSLVKVNGQWRISDLPQTRLLTETQFSDYYRPQDLYFYNHNSSADNPPLVPDSVFVPVGTSQTTLVTNLVLALLQGPKDTWLPASMSSFPPGTTLIGVTIDGTTAVVNLGGAVAHAKPIVLEQISAQLLWTLTGPQAGGLPPPQSVELEIDGQAFIPSDPICGTSPGQSPVQKQATYACYDPYPVTQAGFSFIEQGTAWSRCGSQLSVAAGSIGKVVPVFSRTGQTLEIQPCQGNKTVLIGDQSLPSGQLHSTDPPTQLAVSPDGDYAAYVSSSKGAGTLTIRPVSGGAGTVKTLKEPGVTSLCWDAEDELWFVQDGNVWMASVTGQVSPAPYEGSDNVVALSVAPDGVRIALIVGDGSQKLLELGAISRSEPSGNGQRGSPTVRIGIDPGVQLGPDLAYPDALTWYDADNLLVLASTETAAGKQNILYEVPVDGQSSGELLTPSGATSITAYGPGNALVAGLSDGHLWASASLQGPWQPVGVRGIDPAYPG